MTLKGKLNKAEFAALSAELQAVYTVNPNNAEEYFLDAEDAKELRAANQRNKEEADEAKRLLKIADDEKKAEAKKAQDAADELARKAGDLVSIEKSWEGKVAAAKAEGETTIKNLKKQIENLTINSEATKIAAEISTVPDLVEPLIRARLSLDTEGENAIIRVLGADGKASALNFDDLKKEFVANPKYAAIMKAGEGTGGGAGSNPPGGGAGKDFNTLTTQERNEWYQRDPTGFQRASEANRVAQQQKK